MEASSNSGSPDANVPRPGSVPLADGLRWFGLALALTVISLLLLARWDLALSLSLAPERGAAFGSFVQDWGRKPASLLVIGGAAVLATKSLRAAYPLAVRGSAVLVVQLLLQGLLTNLLKLLSGRPRPVDLGPTGEGFRHFFAVSPGVGDFSFPSGHVAVAMVLAPCALLLWREGRTRAGLAVVGATLVWAGAVAYGRVLHGAHFLTDVVFSVGLGVALAPLCLSLGDYLVRRLSSTSRQ